MSKKTAFTIILKEFNRQVAICNQVSPKKSEVSLFTYSKLEFTSTEVTLTSTNGNLFYSNSIPVSTDLIDQNLSFLVKTDALANITALLGDDKIILEVDLENSNLTLLGNKSKHLLRITTENLAQYTNVVPSSDKLQAKFQVSGSSLIEANRAAAIAIGKHITQPELLNVCYSLDIAKQELGLVSTDRFRIIKTIFAIENPVTAVDFDTTGITNFLLNPKSLQILNSAADEKANITINFESDLAFFEFGASVLAMRYGEGKYIEYAKIIPQSFGCSFTASVSEFLSGIKQVNWCVRNDINKSLLLSFTPNTKTLTLSTKNIDGDTAQCKVSLDSWEGSSEEWSQSFNGDYLSDYLGLLKTSTFLWESNPGKPAVLSPLNEKTKQFYLVSGFK